MLKGEEDSNKEEEVYDPESAFENDEGKSKKRKFDPKDGPITSTGGGFTEEVNS